METLYHYCSTATFHSIIANHSIWLSSLSLSNDSMEGKLVATVVARLAERDGLDQIDIHRLQESIGLLEQTIDGLGFCLSEEGDLLSQWRGYAADATGVAIGFSREYLEQLSESRKPDTSGFILEKVEYDLAAQEAQVKPTYGRVKQLIEEGAFKQTGLISAWLANTEEEIEEIERDRQLNQQAFLNLSITLTTLLVKLFLLKSPAFREEREWRLVSYLLHGIEDICLYRTLPDRVIPYRKFELLGLERAPIDEVVLGPKHTTPIKVIEDFLKQSGFGEVKVRRSEATYR